MTVTLKWVALHEVSDYLAKGWREVKLEGGFSGYSAKALMVSPEEPASEPAKVEPVAAEMPEAVYIAANTLRASGHVTLADALLKEAWHTQPAKVRMTEELERVLATAVHGAAAYMNAKMYGHAEEARLAIAAVRAQAAEAGKVGMPKVLELLREWMDYEPLSDSDDGYFKLWERAKGILAELDAAEVKGEGRG